ncbi:putative transcriptional regulator [Frankia sp. EI5c]|uniref:helix-turn-helix transcriptional regulator n=1 Tax=Frankia sp. EI5c TaxID=683316 RepID=UPI0007C219C1|nr:WYL domain-containing protein [Frankia sp. EI5c]OAA25870.1 putative transcriptional regulator [Frankia sp. EI5c]
MRAGRLLSVLLLLQARGRLTAREIADELAVSVRTVYRDLESLAGAGVPVVAERGSAGGYRLLAGYRTSLTGLTAGESDSLPLAGLPEAAAALGFGLEAATAELKLLAALPSGNRERALRARRLFHLDAPGWFRDAEPVPHLAAVAGAVWGCRRIRITYLRWRSPRQVVRDLEPLGVVLKSGTWYLVAAPAGGAGGAGGAVASPDPAPQGTARVYRVAKILRMEALPESFRHPDGFDLAEYWNGWTERYEKGVYRATATVRLSPEGVRMAPFRLAPAVARAVERAVERAVGHPEADGWVRAELPIESIRHARGDLLTLGAELEVLDPPELRAAMAATAADLAAIYSWPGGGHPG